MLLAAKHVEMVFFARRIWLSLFHLLFLSDLTVVFFWNTWLVDGIFFHFWCRPNFAAICCLRHSFQRPKQNLKNFSGANAPLFTIVEIEVANPNGDLWGYARQIRTRALQLTWSLLAVNFEPRDSFQRPSWCLYEAFCFLCFTCYLPPQMHAPTANFQNYSPRVPEIALPNSLLKP